nr:MAG TPA: hypothetical protein [Crassvirales sp.]
MLLFSFYQHCNSYLDLLSLYFHLDTTVRNLPSLRYKTSLLCRYSLHTVLGPYPKAL